MKITLVISSLSCGGAERVLVLLSQGFIDKGHEVTVVTLDRKETDFYNLPVGTSRIALSLIGKSYNSIHAIWNNIYRLSRLRQAICSTQPDLVISFMAGTNILTILSLLKTGLPIIITEHCDPRLYSSGKIWNRFRHFIYPYADKIVSVSEGVNDAFNWLPIHKKSVIYNPFLPYKEDQSNIQLPPGIDPEKQWIMSMGRLTSQKGFDLLLSAFHKIAQQHQNWQLIILGQGELRDKLEKTKEDLGLSSRVILAGTVKNPSFLLKRAKLFVMSSRFEGFPMAHGEALACGLPVIATDCPSGPREIIRDGIDGLLVPNEDVSALATAMERLMSDEQELNQLAANASDVTQRFSLEKVMGMWEELINEVIKEKKKS